MSKELKASVLAKCESAKNGKIQWLAYKGSELPMEMFEDHNGRGYFQIGGKMFVVTLQFREDTHEDSICWPLAAQILGIGMFSIPEKVWQSNIIAGLEEARKQCYEQGIQEAKQAINKAIYREIWWDGVRAQRDHKVYGDEDKALKHYLKFMNLPHVVEAIESSNALEQGINE